MDKPAHILVVDDDNDIRTLVHGLLARNGMSAATAASASEAEKLLRSTSYDLIILDLMMPEEDGLSFCRRLRAENDIPILMLTALSEDIDRIVGLEMGADDYLPKPFHPRELIARIKSILRRSQGKAETRAPDETDFALRFSGYTLMPSRRLLTDENGSEVVLTSGEFALLLALVEAAPRVLSRDQLLDLSRGAVANPFDRSIDSQVSRLRRKLETDPRQPKFIKTVRNMGYAFVATVKREAA